MNVKNKYRIRKNKFMIFDELGEIKEDHILVGLRGEQASEGVMH